ncbi:MAG: helix-turn-helix transcriptional regulator [bacterium]
MSNLSRITFIDERIRTRGFVTRKEVAEEFEVHIDTVKRDIEYMKLFLNAPLEYSAAKRGYIYSTPFETVFSAAEDAALYYIFVHRITDGFRLGGIPYVPVISKDILAKIKSYVPSDYENILDSVVYDSSDLDIMDIRYFRNILRSIKGNLQLNISYCNAAGVTSSRVIEPMLLTNYLGKWYAIAFCHNRKELAVFLISRITGCSLTDKLFFNSVTSKELKSYFEGSFGMFKSKKTELAVIRVYEPSLHYVKNQKWHKLQTVTEGIEKGRKYLEITLPVGERHNEVIARVMAYAPDSEILSPPHLREKWVKVIKEMAEKYLL